MITLGKGSENISERSITHTLIHSTLKGFDHPDPCELSFLPTLIHRYKVRASGTLSETIPYSSDSFSNLAFLSSAVGKVSCRKTPSSSSSAFNEELPVISCSVTSRSCAVRPAKRSVVDAKILGSRDSPFLSLGRWRFAATASTIVGREECCSAAKAA